jgi:hypothetical protein
MLKRHVIGPMNCAQLNHMVNNVYAVSTMQGSLFRAEK